MHDLTMMVLRVTILTGLISPVVWFIYVTRGWEMRHIDAQVADEFTNEDPQDT